VVTGGRKTKEISDLKEDSNMMKTSGPINCQVPALGVLDWNSAIRQGRTSVQESHPREITFLVI